ncbi:DegV family protein [Hazenella sp. IB182357]|uniref:DegV family protein n=1 Tax=Polycladospora coralii TaxID=2771432 RepID=A0A926NE66_9BACL|nr:DegV family protein [Polycladospora coralii]MBD1371919.1 DegV family protein [Polycladospora coralii]MBS7529379.1 DegV family protein [Polycladospora coralii]
MGKIAVVTDSSCDLPQDVIEKWQIEVVPLRIHYIDQEYRDGIEITADEVADQLKQEIPKTSMPTPEDIYSTFEKLKNSGVTHIIVITVAAAISGTYNTFRLVANEFELEISMVDSAGVSFLLGFLVLEAARLCSITTNMTEILDKIDKTKKQLKGYFIVDTLDYLRAGGRIGKVASSIGSMLNIKPIISLDSEGKLYPHGIARGKKQAIRKMISPILKQLESTRAHIAILHTKAEEEALALKEKMMQYDTLQNLYIRTVSPALMVHAGPGLLGIVIHPLPQDQENA